MLHLQDKLSGEASVSEVHDYKLDRHTILQIICRNFPKNTDNGVITGCKILVIATTGIRGSV